MIHAEKVHELARATLPERDPEQVRQTLAKSGLAGGLREAVQTTFALLVPAIAGGGFGEVLRALQ